MNLGNQVDHYFNLRELFIAGEYLGATFFEFSEKLRHVHAFVLRRVFAQISRAAVVEFLRTANVAVAEMMQAHGYLNEPFIKIS